MKNKQTAVEWLIKRLVIEEDGKYHIELPYGNIDVTSIIEQAKQMEKEQMKSIEPPSDEEIESGMNQRLFLSDKHAHFNSGAKAGFKLGAEWMKEQILNQNK